jgi:hypothetical protein
VSFPFFPKKGRRSHELVEKLLACCLTQRDFQFLTVLLAKGEITSSEQVIEPFFHRLGKLLDVRLEEINKPDEN